MASNALGLKTAVRTTLFRATVQILQVNPALKKTVKTWRVWSNKPDDSAPLNQANAPAVRISPLPGPMTWWSPGTMKSKLFFALELSLLGLDVDDVMNFQSAIEDALFPSDVATSNAQILALQALGARTGQYEFMAPLSDPPNTAGTAGKFWLPSGMFALEFNRNFLPPG